MVSHMRDIREEVKGCAVFRIFCELSGAERTGSCGTVSSHDFFSVHGRIYDGDFL